MEKTDILGNVRTGTKSEKDHPIPLSYFDVHKDKSTSMLAVEIFNETFSKPKELIIKPAKKEPLQIFYERYGGKRIKCYGNNSEAREIDEKGNKVKIECNENCKYRQDKTCKRRARFYFRIKGIEEEGIWCYPMGSENGIDNVDRYLKYCKRKNMNIEEMWFRLFLEEQPSISGKNYVPDIQKIDTIDKKEPNVENKNEKEEKQEKQSNSNDNKNNFLLYKGGKMADIQGKKIPQLYFKTTKNEDLLLYLDNASNREILKLDKQSVILPLKEVKINNGIVILRDYKIIKAIQKETKKAV